MRAGNLGRRAAILVAGIDIKQKRDHDEGGRWITERKLVKIMGTASVIFASVIFAENMSELLDAPSL